LHPEFKSYGNLEVVAVTSMNSVKAWFVGPFIFEFKNGEKIELHNNPGKVGSLMSGSKRTYKYID